MATDGEGGVLVFVDTNSTEFQFGEQTVNIGVSSIMLGKFSGGGQPLWAKSPVLPLSNGHLAPKDVVVDQHGNIFLTGSYWGSSPDFGGGQLGDFGSQSSGFLVKLASDAEHVWSRGFGANASNEGSAIHVSVDGVLTLAGLHSAQNSDWGIDLGGGQLKQFGSASIFVARFAQ